MLWLIITSAIIIIFIGIITLKLELYYLRRKSDIIWVMLEKEHLKLGELAIELTTVLKFHDVNKTKSYKNVLISHQHLKAVNTIWDKFQVYRTMLFTLRNLIEITKEYPECRANNKYLKLIDTIKEIEERIDKYSLSYNKYTIIYNKSINFFPLSFVAKLFKLTPKNLI